MREGKQHLDRASSLGRLSAGIWNPHGEINQPAHTWLAAASCRPCPGAGRATRHHSGPAPSSPGSAVALRAGLAAPCALTLRSTRWCAPARRAPDAFPRGPLTRATLPGASPQALHATHTVGHTTRAPPCPLVVSLTHTASHPRVWSGECSRGLGCAGPGDPATDPH